jgi:hypothetical protein
VKAVQRCENLFQQLYDLHAHDAGLLQTIAQAVITDVQLPVTCVKFPATKFVKFFVKLRIYYMLKFQNRTLAEPKANAKAVKKNSSEKKLNKLKHI